jgi:hypothetical protein
VTMYNNDFGSFVMKKEDLPKRRTSRLTCGL